jgi:hypothetical protein
MASPVRGLLDPKNAVDGGGSKFQEGLFRVDKSEFEVFQKRGAKDQTPPAPITALVWTGTRLDEDHRPLMAEDGQPLVERLDFSLGSTSLAYVHPARANGPDDGDLEDAGEQVGASGPTIVCAKSGWSLNKKSGFAVLAESLDKAGYFKPDEAVYEWAPSYEGAIFYMKPAAQSMEKDGKNEQYFQKVVAQVVKWPGKDAVAGKTAASGGKAAASGKAAAPAKSTAKVNGAAAAQATAPPPAPPAETEAVDPAIAQQLIELLPGVIGKKLGTKMSLKTWGTQLGMAAITAKIKGPTQIAMVNLAKDTNWLEENGVVQIGDDIVQPVFNEERTEVTFQVAG